MQSATSASWEIGLDGTAIRAADGRRRDGSSRAHARDTPYAGPWPWFNHRHRQRVVEGIEEGNDDGDRVMRMAVSFVCVFIAVFAFFKF
jgi:hypothetical protein